MANLFEHCRLMPVITPYTVESTVELVNCLKQAGVSAVEITLRTDCALDALKATLDELSNTDVLIGAGTINSAQDFKTVTALGVDFTISPGISKNLLDAAAESPTPLLPGITSPSDIMLGLEYGIDHFKLFPAEILGGVALLKALGGPYPKLKFCPTGGINIDNVASYLQLENTFCIGGSWMLPKDAILNGEWDKIYQLTKRALKAVDSIPVEK